MSEACDTYACPIRVRHKNACQSRVTQMSVPHMSYNACYQKSQVVQEKIFPRFLGVSHSYISHTSRVCHATLILQLLRVCIPF